jgi:transposase
MPEMVVGLDLHLKKTQGTVMSMDGEVLRQGRFSTSREDLRKFLEGIPSGTKVALESVGFCWPWINYIEELGHNPLLANPLKLKAIAEDVKTDKVDSELLANLTRMNYLPTVFVPDKDMRWLRSLLRHRMFRRKISTALKNRTWSEFRKRDTEFNADLGTIKGRRMAGRTGIHEVSQNIEILEVVESQMKQIEAGLKERYEGMKPVQWMQSIPGIGFIIALTLYAEICDIKRFPNPDKLAHYSGLVPRVRQSGEHAWMGREAKANKWLKWAFVEAAWSHVNWCPNGRLAKVYEAAYRRKKDKKKAIKIVARKLVNIVWAVWTYGKEFTMIPDKA